jgi:phosphotransferase system HPr-like phosphotransfer protein
MKVTIRLSTIEDVRNFVEAIRTFDSDIDLISGRYRVDAKSIMGIFSLDLMSPITLETNATNCDVIKEKIKSFIIAE